MPALSPHEQFQKTLNVAAIQLKKKKISVRFGPTGKMRFVIDEASLKETLAVSGVEESKFRETFDSEVGPLLEAVVRDNVEEYIDSTQYRHAEDSDRKTWPARKATLVERANLVRNAITDPELRGRYLIKTTSKHPRLRKYAWEVTRKVSLSSETEVLAFPVQPYATISFETIRPDPAVGPLVWLPFFPFDSVGRSEFCTFDCDEVDLEDLIKDLQNAKTALSKTSGSDVNGR
jgi:hypothetical protein